MNSSTTIKALSAALVKVQGEIEHAHKNATNPHYRNKYADLTEVLDTVRPVLSKHGLSVVQFPGYVEGVATVETILTHESGEWMAGTAGARVQKDDPQGVGSAITYLRRYSLAAVCGIGQEDDDAESASQQPKQAHTPAQRPSSEPVGVKHGTASEGFSLDEPIPVGKHKGKTWRAMIAEDRSYVEWAVKSMDRLSFDAKEALSAALNAPQASGADVVKLQDLLNRAANANIVTMEQAEMIEKIIDEADAKKVADTIHRIETRLATARVKQPAAVGADDSDGELPF